MEQKLSHYHSPLHMVPFHCFDDDDSDDDVVVVDDNFAA